MVPNWSEMPRKDGWAGVEGDTNSGISDFISRKIFRDSLRGTLWYVLLDINRVKKGPKGKYEEMK